MLESLTCEMFARHLGETFRVFADAEHYLDVELIEAVEVPSSAPPSVAQRTPFSIIFRGPRAIVLPQQIYRIEQEQLGALEIFLVPIGPDQTGMCYQAIFT